MIFRQSESRQPRSLKRIVWLLGVCVAVGFSLLSFPSVLSWVLLFWLLLAASLAHFNRVRAAAGSLLFAVVLVILRGPFCGTQVGFCLACFALALFAFGASLGEAETHRSFPLFRIGFSIALLALVVFSYDRWSATISDTKPIDSKSTVLCLGDSLTSGLPSIGGYPTRLQKLRQGTVVNFGREGITADEALPMVAGLLEFSPDFVVIELGGHDFLKKQSRSSTKSDLLQIIDSCQAAEMDVILCEVPRGFIFDPYYGLEREIARDRDLRLISDTMIRKLVLFSPFAPPGLWLPDEYRLSDDGLHPNEAGNAMLARTVNSYLP